METKISSKSELSSLASKLMTQMSELKSTADELETFLSGIQNYEDINVSGVGSVIASNISSIYSEMEIVSKNIKNYAFDIEEFDKYDLDIEAVLNGDTSAVGLTNGDFLGPVTPVDSTFEDESEPPSKPVGQPETSDSKPSNPKLDNDSKPSSPKPVQPSYSPVQDENSSEMGNPEVDTNKIGNNDVSILDRPVDNSGTNSNTPNIQYTDNSDVSGNVNSNVGSSNGGLSDGPITENSVVNSGNVDEQITSDILNNELSDDVYVSDQSGYIGQTNSNIPNDVTTNSNISSSGSAIPGILGGLGAAAVVGLGAVGGAKVIKNMKENQEIDDDDDEE